MGLALVAEYHLDAGNKFSAGDVVKPTIRPEVSSSVGKVYFPNGAGAALPGVTPSSSVPIKVKPAITIPKAGIASKLKNFIKLNPAQVALSVASSAAVAAVGWVMTEGIKPGGGTETKIQKPSPGLVEGLGIPYMGAGAAGCAFAYSHGAGAYDGNGWQYVITTGAPYQSNGFTYVSNCEPFYASQRTATLQNAFVVSPSSKADLTDSDFLNLDNWVGTAATAAMLADIIKEVCAGSLSPSTCYAEVEDRSLRKNSGPVSSVGPSSSTSSTYTKPDGSPGTKTKTDITNYTFNYGNNYFDTNTTTTTTYTTDGVETGKDTVTDTTEPATPEPNTDEEPKPEEQTYTFTDSALPTVNPFYTQKYPEGLSGVWNDAKSGFENAPFISFLNSFIPGWGGSCPAWSMSFDIGSMANYGSIGFGNLCYVFAFIKACMMLGAVFFARSAIFGG